MLLVHITTEATAVNSLRIKLPLQPTNLGGSCEEEQRTLEQILSNT